jgi:hypothetical protein
MAVLYLDNVDKLSKLCCPAALPVFGAGFKKDWQIIRANWWT